MGLRLLLLLLALLLGYCDKRSDKAFKAKKQQSIDRRIEIEHRGLPARGHIGMCAPSSAAS